MWWRKSSSPLPGQKTGPWSESQAAQHLARQGYGILATNYRKRYGEIDIIARKRELVVFVEVKYRKSTAFGSGMEAVDLRKQQRICRVALEFLQERQIADCAVRFDVIALQPGTDGHLVLEHLENAFDCAG